ncbi:hypothetical protein DPMN_179375 [Dreissena polymorpha]|uniref:TIR domain-containing protein n=1 Tax=Dreissena polymorpha TaxID=45954 RepID=A0A9D4EFY7_DREPO|nr:hypothetical protein DPMN_179375 [Dreissena polymorpha]
MMANLELLANDAADVKFAALLIYSSAEEVFVDDSIYGPLNQTLQQVTGINRNLIATGDRNCRCGGLLLNEFLRCANESLIVLVFLSDNFCRSQFCCYELEKAFQLQKPIILMMKDKVDIRLMPPILRQLFNTYVRVLWKL